MLCCKQLGSRYRSHWSKKQTSPRAAKAALAYQCQDALSPPPDSCMVPTCDDTCSHDTISSHFLNMQLAWHVPAGFGAQQGAAGLFLQGCQEACRKALAQCSRRLCSLVTWASLLVSEKPPIPKHCRASNLDEDVGQGMGKYHWTPASAWGFSLDLQECKITPAKTSYGARSGLFYLLCIYNCNVNCHGAHLYMTFRRQLTDQLCLRSPCFYKTLF